MNTTLLHASLDLGTDYSGSSDNADLQMNTNTSVFLTGQQNNNDQAGIL